MSCGLRLLTPQAEVLREKVAALDEELSLNRADTERVKLTIDMMREEQRSSGILKGEHRKRSRTQPRAGANANNHPQLSSRSAPPRSLVPPLRSARRASHSGLKMHQLEKTFGSAHSSSLASAQGYPLARSIGSSASALETARTARSQGLSSDYYTPNKTGSSVRSSQPAAVANDRRGRER